MSAQRKDLAQLTPEALAQLANLGLVKRAQKELAGGYVPNIRIEVDGHLHAEFPDQVRTEFAPGAGLKDARCSCGAPLCRHRIAVVLQHAATAADADAAELPAAADFSSLDLAQVQAQTAASLWPRVERELRQGVRIELERSLASDQRSLIHSARLPQATVRFYAGADLAFARCDCTAQSRCEHIALGALALAQAGPLGDARRAIELGGTPRTQTAELSTEPYLPLLRLLLQDGLAHGAAERAETAAALSAALAASRALAATWLTLCLEALELWLDGYRQRSARFALSEGLQLLRELSLRLGAATATAGELSARSVLGIGEAMESPLDRLSLISLGLRVQADGPHRRATLAVVDCDTQTLLSLHKTWQRPADSTHGELALLDQQRVAGSLRLARLAAGTLVTTTARRRANGELKLGQSFAGKASIGAQNGDWSRVLAPLRIDSQAEYLRQQQLAPPQALAARTALPNFHVLQVAQVAEIGFDPGQQCLHAVLIDPSGAAWTLQREHAAANPGALDAIARVLLARADTTASTAPLYVAGTVQREAGSLCIEPWALSAGGVVVPDASAADGALAGVRLSAAARTANDPLAAFLQALDDALCEALRDGLARRSGLLDRLTDLIERSRELGLHANANAAATSVTARLEALRGHSAQLQGGSREALQPAVDALLQLASWSALAQHALAALDFDDANADEPMPDDEQATADEHTGATDASL
jgi:hypothetical protein